MARAWMIFAGWCLTGSLLVSPAQAQTLDEDLRRIPAVDLAGLARKDGDAIRGAVVFFQHHMACSRCHSVGNSQPSWLGPDLATLGKEATDESLVEAVLTPSKVIRKGFESVTVGTADGKTVNGLLVERTTEKLVLRDVSRGGELTTLLAGDIEEAKANPLSIMPAGQVNQLASRQQFFDLIRYLMEIRDGGAARARALQPSPALLTFTLPEYEAHIDHAGLIGDWNADSLKRGEAIYRRVCQNCHGTREQPGSLPTSLRFAEGKFKNGSEPLAMYQTLTRGFGLMAPQTWMAPSQKYDVIHYIRETYLRPHNSSQWVSVDAAYLARLPKGNTRGPEPSKIEPWSAMDYGPSLAHTVEVPGQSHNFAYKGIAVRLDPGAGGVSRGRHWMVFDADTLRVAAAWSAPVASALHDSDARNSSALRDALADKKPAKSPQDSGIRNDTATSENFIDWRGIQFNGEHQIHPRIVGAIAFANSTGPGWANPSSGSFVDDQRVEGRDSRRYGPLPRDWGKFRGLYHYGQQVVLSYSIGKTSVLESPRLASGDESSAPAFLRTFNIGPRDRDLILQIAEHPGAEAGIAKLAHIRSSSPKSEEWRLRLQNPVSASDAERPLAFDGDTFLEVANGEAFDLTTKDFTIAARLKTSVGGTIFAIAQPGPKWTPDGQTLFIRDGRLGFDIGWVGAVVGKSKINDGKWHNVAMTWQQSDRRVRLFIDGQLDGEGTLAAKARLTKSVVRIGFTAPNFPQPDSYWQGELAEVRFYQRQYPKELNELVEPKPMEEELLARWLPDKPTSEHVRDTTGHKLDAEIRRGNGVSAPTIAPLIAGVAPLNSPVSWAASENRLLLKMPAGEEPLKFTVWMATDWTNGTSPSIGIVPDADLDLESLTKGGPARWPQKLETRAAIGRDDGPFAVDVLTAPETNPWLAQTRFTGLDFFPDGRIAVCSWDGDVWIVDPVTQAARATGAPEPGTLRWQRIATGLFQPLGLKIVNEKIHVICRDQLAVLHDLNGDGEIDFYECLNNDHQVTEHFHEFAMGLQTDAEGNFYYAKSGRHALKAVVPHHGTLLKVSRDGAKTEILANGFRAANGVCLNPDGSFVVTDQEGFWNPKNRINWVTLDPSGKPKFYGNMFGYTDVTDPSDSAMEPPLCWITNAFDRSPAELLWVTSDRWGPLNGSLLNLSYGYGKVFVVPHEKVRGVMQGGMIELPLPPFPTGVMRGRFHPTDGQLYLCGMFAWAGSAIHPGGLYRLRATGEPMHLPVGLNAMKSRLRLTFTEPLDPTSLDSKNVQIKTWLLKRTANYGSKHFDEKTLSVRGVSLSADGKTLAVDVPELQSTWCMEIQYELRSANGKPIAGLIHNTIHELADN